MKKMSLESCYILLHSLFASCFDFPQFDDFCYVSDCIFCSNFEFVIANCNWKGEKYQLM